jgi:hypothetical protein
MIQSKKGASKPPRKLTPRPAAQPESPVTEAVAVAAVAAPELAPVAPAATVAVAETPAAVTPAAKAPATKTAKKAKVPDETTEKHKQALVDALKKAEAARITQPLGKPSTRKVPAAKAEKTAKPAKPVKPPKPEKLKKPKLVRDSFAMPEKEYAEIGGLKKRLAALKVEVKKSELLRAGVLLLTALNETELSAVVGRIERIKTGRPSKK